ncbi:MAG TPA: glycosyltransferase family 4 protein [Candidatus Limnocylindria bacterium]|nr:glycosyltransferase family 4 protein [Candidatus Limnocylindria bacterium]
MAAEISEVVLVAFEGPDRYSFVGGLATRMNDLAEALIARGHRVRQLFVGDPTLPATELRNDGRLLLERWGQWISRYHPKDVYDGEDGKWRDFSRTVPPHLLEEVIVPAARQGKRAILLFEDWQTANAAIDTTVLAQRAGLRGAITPFWNANNTYGFGAIDFPLLARAATITTISRFMRAELVRSGVEPEILPNGIAPRFAAPVPPADLRAMRAGLAGRPSLVKVARFDADKRWLWAIDAIAHLRDRGTRPRLMMRGSRSDYADIVGARIRERGLSVQRVALGADAPPAEVAAALGAVDADVAFLDFFASEPALRALYGAADGVLANSEKEPFGLVGLEVMGAGGIAFVGRTGEDYAIPYGNSVVVQSDDPRELLTHLAALGARPELGERIRADGRMTAERYVWPRLLDALEASWETAATLG